MSRPSPEVVKRLYGPSRRMPDDDELTSRGLVKKLIAKSMSNDRGSLETALDRAKAMSWWGDVADKAPYSSGRYWVFLVHAAEAA